MSTVAGTIENENWKGETGLVTDVLRRDLKNASECEAYICGSAGMIEASVKVVTEHGMSEENIFFDKFE